MNNEASETPEFSVVIPFFNEEECLWPLLDEVAQVMGSISYPYEVVAVDDGSSDQTRQLLNSRAALDPHLRVLGWDDNRGQAAALLHGLHAARGPVVVTLDGDGQNDPADIPALLAALGDADMVVGIRTERQDSWLRRWMSRLANGVRGRILHDHMRDSGCALKSFRREVIAAFLPIRTLYSFMPALAVGAGFRVEQQPVRHRPRQGGQSNYGLRRMLWQPAMDMLGVRWYIQRRVGSFE